MPNSMRWETDPGFRLPGGDPAWIETRGEGTVLRSVPGRTVSRVLSPDGTRVIVKAWRARGWLDALRLVFTSSPGRRERDRAREALARGVPVARPLALGERRRFGFLLDSLLAFECLEGVPLDAALASRPPGDPARNRLLEALAGFLREVHDRGLHHGDLHAGNVLFREDPGRLRFFLLDLGAARFRARMGTREREEGLAQIGLFLLGRTSAAERMRFLRGYLGASAGREERRDLARRMGIRTEREARILWERRERRCTAENREFAPWAQGAFRGYARRGPWPAPGEDPARVFEPGRARVLKDSRGALSVLFEGGGGWVFGKRYRLRSWAEALRGLFRPSRALRAWRRAYALELRGIPTPRPLLAASRRVLGIPVESVFFCEGLPDARGLDALARESRAAGREGGRRLRAFLPLLGRAVGALHRLGFSHRDLKAGNLLASGGGTPAPFLADLEGLRYLRAVSPPRREKDLARFLRSAREDCGLTRADWMRVLAAYARAASGPAGGLRALATAVDLRARAARNGGGA